MKIIKMNKYEVSANETIILDLCENKPGDTVVGEIYLDVPTTNTITAQGCVDEDWHALKAVDMGNYAIKNSITAAGYYMYPTSGLSKIKFTIASEGEITIKELF